MNIQKKKDTTKRKVTRRDLLKFTSASLVGLATLLTSSKISTGKDSLNVITKSIDKENGSNIATAQNKFFYETRVILNIFNKRIKIKSGYGLSSIKRVKHTALITYTKKNTKNIEFYIISSELIKLDTPFIGESAQIVLAPGTKIQGNKQKILIQEVITLLDQNNSAHTLFST